MTDLTRTLNVYYTASQFVDPAVSQTAQPAMVDEKLIYPLIKDASQFQVALTKCKVPLDTIPLSQSNIPLKGWEVSLRKNGFTGNAYVAQINSNVATNYVWSATLGVVSKYTYSSTGVLSLVGLIDISATMPYISMICVDDFQNLYVIGRNTQYGLDNLFYVFSNSLTPTVYFNETGTNYTCVAIDRNQTIFLADQNSGVSVYTNVPSETGVSLTFLRSITLDFNDAVLQNIATVCSDYTTVIGYDANKIQVYNSEYQPVSSPITLADITNLGNQSSILHDQNTFILSDAGVSLDNLYGQVFGGNQANSVSSGTQSFVGSWNDVPHPQQSQVNCMGVGNDGQTYTVVNNPTADPVLFANNTFATKIASNTENSWFGLNTGTDTLNYINSESNGIYPLATDFKDTAGIFQSFDIDKTTGVSYQVAHADNKLYKSNHAIAPLTIYTGIPTGGIADNMHRYDCFPSLNLSNEITPPFSMTPYLPYYPLGMYEFLDSGVPSYFVVYTQLTEDTGIAPPNFAFYVYKKSDMSTTRFTGISGNSSIGGGYAQPVNMCRANGTLCLFNGIGGFYFFNETTWALETGFTVPITIDGVNTVSMTQVGGDLLLISTGTEIALATYTGSLLGWDVGTFYPIGLPSPYTNIASMYVTDFFFDGITTVTMLAFGTDPRLANIVTMSYENFGGVISPVAHQVYPSKSYDASRSKFGSALANIMDSNSYFSITNLNYFTVPSVLPSLDPSGIDVWYFHGSNPLSFVSNLAIPYFQLGFNLIPQFIVCASDATSLYTYDTNVPTSLDGTLNYISLSATNTNVIYGTDTSGLLYEGFRNVSPIVFTLKPTTGSINYFSIAGCKAQVFDSYACLYSLSNQELIEKYSLGNSQFLGLTRNTITGQYFSSVLGGTTPLIAYPATTLIPIAWSSSQQLGSIFVKNGENIDAGPASIYTYQTLIDAINVAFQVAFVRANVNGAGLVTAPSISMNFQTGLCTMHYDGEYVNSVNGILTNNNGILFNNNLNNLIRFNSKPDTIAPSMYLLYLTNESGVSPYSSLQNTKTITIFNKLDKILVQSNTIYVAQSYFGNNQTNNVITDIDIDTSAIIENVGQWLLYQPNFLRPFLLASNNAIDRIQLMIGYSYIDGTTYQLTINPQQGWNLKLDFVRKFSF